MEKEKSSYREKEILEKMEEMLEKNLEISRRIEKISRRAEKHIKLANIFGYIKFGLVVIILILIFIYVPPFVQKLLEAYQEFWKAINSFLPTNG